MATHEAPVERRLAAILAADVVGYSRLMGADEVGTRRALQACRRCRERVAEMPHYPIKGVHRGCALY
jgi:class 3 adenylate cyclase